MEELGYGDGEMNQRIFWKRAKAKKIPTEFSGG